MKHDELCEKINNAFIVSTLCFCEERTKEKQNGMESNTEGLQ